MSVASHLSHLISHLSPLTPHLFLISQLLSVSHLSPLTPTSFSSLICLVVRREPRSEVSGTDAMVEYSQTHGAQPGEPPIDDGASLDFEHGDSGVEQSADEQPDEPPQQMPNTSNASRAAVGSRRSRCAERDRGYLLQPIAILASEFYGEASAKELFPQIWRRHLIRGEVVAFVRGSSIESDRRA